MRSLCSLQSGYREGITAGKLSTLQEGFDQAFAEVGVPLGRQVGLLRGKMDALLFSVAQLLSALEDASSGKEQGETEPEKLENLASARSSHAEMSAAASAAIEIEADSSETPRPARAGLRRTMNRAPPRSRSQSRSRAEPRAATTAPSLGSHAIPFLPLAVSSKTLRQESALQNKPLIDSLHRLRDDLTSIQNDAVDLTFDKLAEPDWEAMEHEYEHLKETNADKGGAPLPPLQRESDTARRKREAIVPHFKERVERAEEEFVQLLVSIRRAGTA